MTSCLDCSRTPPLTATRLSRWTWRSSEWLESSTKPSLGRILNSRRYVRSACEGHNLILYLKAKDQIVIDELTTHTDTGRQELIHPYKTLYGRDLNSVLKDNLGDSWEEACATLMAEMRMYELECLRRRMEDEAAAMAAREAHEIAENNSMLSSIKSPTSMRSARSSGSKGSGSKSSKKKNGTAKMKIEDMLDECATEEETFSGHSCLLITWKTNPEVEKFKELYMDKEIKTHKRKNKTPVDPGDLVSEKSLNRVYKILGRVSSILFTIFSDFIIC